MKPITPPNCIAQPEQQLRIGKLLRPAVCSTFACLLAAAPLQADQLVEAPQNQPSQAQQSLQDLEAHHFNDSDVLIVSVGSSVFSDFDNDGFFTRFSLSFDADVRYGEEWVYANIFLRGGGGDYRFFHSSDAFEIYDTSSFDEYRLDSELVSNYPAGYYDVRIELRDAFNDRLLDAVDASTHRTLFALPLESQDSSNFENSVDPQILGPLAIDLTQPEPLREQIVHEQVGAAYALLPLLGLGLLARRQRKQQKTTTRSLG